MRVFSSSSTSWAPAVSFLGYGAPYTPLAPSKEATLADAEAEGSSVSVPSPPAPVPSPSLVPHSPLSQRVAGKLEAACSSQMKLLKLCGF